MRVLFVTSAYPAHPDDPRGIHIHRLARALCRAGVHITVVSPGAPAAARAEVLDGVLVQRVPYWIPKWQRLATGLGGIVPNLRQSPWLSLQVPPLITALTWRACALASAFDVIHAHWLYPAGIAGLISARAHRIPLVVTSHGGDLNLARHSRLLHLLTSRISQAADVCVGVSDALCEQFVSLGVVAKRVMCIPAGVEVTAEQSSFPEEASRSYQEFKTFAGFRLVYVGSLIPRKSVDTLLEAHDELVQRKHAIASAIVGPGPLREVLQDIVRKRALRHVFFADAQSPSAVPGWMSAAHALVLPSLSEGRPVVVMEAMALGLPVVATNISGTRELVRDEETGLLFTPRDAIGLANCIERLIRDEGLRQELGRRARTRVEEDGLTLPRVVQKHLALYAQLCEPRQRSARTEVA